MNRNLVALLILILTLATALAASAAPPGPPGATRPGGDLPSINPPGSGLSAQTQLLLPKTLIINDFVITDVTYAAGSSLKSATGQGKGVFTGANSNEFTLNFTAVEIQNQGQQGRITKGTITKDFSPLLTVDLAQLDGRVRKLYLTPTETKVSLDLLLPTLWMREKILNTSQYKPAQQAWLTLNDVKATQALDIYETGFTGHGLGEIGIGDTGIVLDFAGAPLTVDLSKSKGGAWMGVRAEGKIETVPRPELKDTNIGFCYGSYRATGTLITAEGLAADLELMEELTYTTTVPMGYRLALQPKALTIQGGSQHNTASGLQTGSSQSGISQQAKVDFNQIDPEYKNAGNTIKKSPQGFSQYHGLQTPVAAGVLRLAQSAVKEARYNGTLTMPADVTKPNGDPYDCPFTDFIVDAELTMRGALTCEAPLCWAGSRYGLQAVAEGTVFFPGQDGADLNWTKIVSSQEAFATPPDLTKVPGVTFLYFHLGIKVEDASHAVFVPTMMPPGMNFGKQYPFRAIGNESGCWLNVGANGINGKMEIESAIGLRDYPIKLGGALPFQAFLHGNATKPDYEHYANITKQIKWGKFFRAYFVDGAVFDLGMNGHFEVAGPSEIQPDMLDLGATSTAALTSARVEVNAELKYWGVTMVTKDSRIVPQADRVFFLGSTIEEEAHYAMGFPVVWGEMTGDGDFPALLFGYGTPQYFDGIPFSYTDVRLTPWPGAYPPPAQKWGAIVSTGDLFFPFFGSQNMIIADHKHVQAPADHEGKMVLIDVGGKDYFAFTGRTWGGGRGIFNFPQIKYFDGAEQEDGFKGAGRTWVGEFKLPDQTQGLAGEIHLTSMETLVSIDNGPVPLREPFDQAFTSSFVKGAIHITSDTVPQLDLETNFAAGAEMLGGFPGGQYALTVLPERTILDITAALDLAMAPGVSFKADEAHLNLVFGPDSFAGRVDVKGLSFTAGNVGGRGEGGFGVFVSPAAKYFQGYGTVTINGVPWPLPNSGGGALVLAYQANPADLYALGYISLGEVQKHLSGNVTGFYLGCKVGYNYGFAGLGNAWIYFSGGAGLLYPTLLFHSGLSGGVRVCGIGLSSGAEIGGFADVSNPHLDLTGTLHYELDLLFFELDWTKTITLNSDGSISY